VIYPFGNISRVHLNKKKEHVGNLVPLEHSLTILSSSLPFLVGITIAKGFEEIKYQGKISTKHPYKEREETINVIRKEYKV